MRKRVKITFIEIVVNSLAPLRLTFME
jgi:hypothetical protein